MPEILSPATLSAFVLGYAFGSLPFGLILTRIAGLGDIRSIGSGNIGATNVLRTGHKGLAAATLLLDALKGTLAVLIASSLWGSHAALAGALGAFLGHVFPIWLGFRGGKGVATYIGILVALSWPVAMAFCAVWLVVAVLTRYSSLSALTASLAAPALLWATGQANLAALVGVLSILLIGKHHANIQRLIAGTESKIGARP